MEPEKQPEAGRTHSLPGLIQTRYAKIPRSELPLADRMLAFPEELLLYSATELAGRTGASKAAVSRLVKRLGFRDYREMQRAMRDAQAGSEGALQPGTANTGASSASRHLERDVASLRATYEQIDKGMVREVAQRIASARRVACLGYSANNVFASYLCRQLSRIRTDVVLLPDAGQSVAERGGDFGRHDLLIAIGLRPRSDQLIRAMEMFHDRGVPIAYVTDRRAVQSRSLASWVFSCHLRGLAPFDSHVGAISLLNLLATRAFHAAGRKGRKRFDKVETLCEALGERNPDL